MSLSAGSALSSGAGGAGGVADGGAWKYITSASADGDATIDLKGMDDTYQEYVIVGRNFLSSVASNNLRGYMYVEGSLDTTGPYNFTQKASTTSTFGGRASTTSASSFLLGATNTFPSNTTGESLNFQLTFCNARNSNYYTFYEGFGTDVQSGYSETLLMNGIHKVVGSKITGIRLYTTSGTMKGELFLYGIQQEEA